MKLLSIILVLALTTISVSVSPIHSIDVHATSTPVMAVDSTNSTNTTLNAGTIALILSTVFNVSSQVGGTIITLESQALPTVSAFGLAVLTIALILCCAIVFSKKYWLIGVVLSGLLWCVACYLVSIAGFVSAA